VITDVYLQRIAVLAFAGGELLYSRPIAEKLDELKATTEEIRWHVGNFGKGVRSVSKAEFVRIARETIEKAEGIKT
jgi:hypothetical protein